MQADSQSNVTTCNQKPNVALSFSLGSLLWHLANGKRSLLPMLVSTSC
jgi:hypothetical protein